MMKHLGLLLFLATLIVDCDTNLERHLHMHIENVLKFIKRIEDENSCTIPTQYDMKRSVPSTPRDKDSGSSQHTCSVIIAFDKSSSKYGVKILRAQYTFQSDSSLKKITKMCSSMKWSFNTSTNCKIQAHLPLGADCETNEQCLAPRSECKRTDSFNGKCSCPIDCVQINQTCYPAHLPFGADCEINEQCHAARSECKRTDSYNGKCSCPIDCIQINQTCYPGFLHIGAHCIYNQQCTETQNAGTCSKNSCSCNQGFVREGSNCIQAHLPLGAACETDEQCHGPRSECKRSDTFEGKCSCPANDVQINQACHPGGIELGKSCVHDGQCTGTYLALNCSKSESRRPVCSCFRGLINIDNQTCVQGFLHIGAHCTYNHQCTGTPNASTCSNNTCSCKRGLVQKGSNCIPEHEASQKQLNTQQTSDASEKAGSVVGAAFVGLVVGALIVIVIVIILYRKRIQALSYSGAKELTSVSNQAYESGMRIESQSNTGRNEKRSILYNNVENESNDPEISLVLPICKQQDAQNLKSASNDDIYNHLNETESDQRDDTYDHAHPVQGAEAPPTDEDAYMHIQMKEGSDGHGKTLEAGNDDSEDNYFILEKKKEQT